MGSCSNLDALREGTNALLHLWPEVPDETLKRHHNMIKSVHRTLELNALYTAPCQSCPPDRLRLSMTGICSGGEHGMPLDMLLSGSLSRLVSHLDRPCSSIAERADGVALDLLCDFPQHVDLLNTSIPLLHARHDVIQPGGAFSAAGKALAQTSKWCCASVNNCAPCASRSRDIRIRSQLLQAKYGFLHNALRHAVGRICMPSVLSCVTSTRCRHQPSLTLPTPGSNRP